jgi:hypothetical protein
MIRTYIDHLWLVFNLVETCLCGASEFGQSEGNHSITVTALNPCSGLLIRFRDPNQTYPIINYIQRLNDMNGI